MVQKQPEEEEPLQAKLLSGQTKEVTPDLESRVQSLRTGGQPLPKSTRAFFESRFGVDFSNVRVHTNPHAGDTAKNINSHAFTMGQNILFGQGQYAADTDRGKRLIDHELTHFIQQNYSLPAFKPHEGGGICHKKLSIAGVPIHMIQRQCFRNCTPNRTGNTTQTQADSLSNIQKEIIPSVPYYVSFQNVSPPAIPDQTLSSPGPSELRPDRAGFTRVRVRKHMTIAWGHGSARSDGKIPFFARSVNIFFRLDPIEVFLSSDYSEDSCPYQVTLEHERSHVRDFLRIFHSYRQPLIRRLNSISFPTENNPLWVTPGNLTSLQETLSNPVVQAIREVANAMKTAMEADRNTKDSPAAYAVVYARCPTHAWIS